MLLQANDFLWSARPPRLRDPDRRVRPVGQHHRRCRPDPPQARRAVAWPLLAAAAEERRHQARQDRRAARCGSIPTKTSPYQFRQYWIQTPTTTRSAPAAARSRSRPLERGARRHRRARRRHRTCGSPSGRSPTRLTALVHGDAAAVAADEAADVLFGGDPTAASEAALPTVAARVPSSRWRRAELDDLVGCSWRPDWPHRRVTPVALSTAPATLQRGALDANSQLSGLRTAPRAVPAAAARARSRTTSSKFFLTPGCAITTGALVFSPPHGAVFTPPERPPAPSRPPETRPNSATEIHRSWCVPELRLLENGREDRTPVRAVRQGPPSGRETELLVNFAVGIPCRRQHECNQSARACTCGSINQQGRIVHMSFPDSLRSLTIVPARSNR